RGLPARRDDVAGGGRRARLRLLRVLHADDGHLSPRARADGGARAGAPEVRGAGPGRGGTEGMTRFGLIGYGLWGRHHASAIAQAPGAVLTAIACRSEATAAAARRDFPGVPVHLDYQELVSRADVDVVDVVVPNDLHA